MNSSSIVNWLEGNLDTIPYFTNSDIQDYTLQWASPCVDAGTLELPDGIVLPEYDLAGNPRIAGGTIDMGAFELQPDVVFEYDMDWNLVGTPVSAYDFSCSIAYENTLYSYHPVDGYVLSDTLISGLGYWHRFEEDGNCVYTGPPVFDLLITLHEGWNLISGISVPIDVDYILDPNALIIPGTIYGYDIGYVEAETLNPGYGYWMRSNGEGEITISTTSRTSERVLAFTPDENLNTLSVNKQTLYFGADVSENEKLSYSLPPKPPAGANDIRFTGDTKLCEGDDCVIEMTQPSEGLPARLFFGGNPSQGFLTLEYDINNVNSEWLLMNSETGEKHTLSGAGALEIPTGNATYQLSKTPFSIFPSTFSLKPAYPNPFNPITTISFSIPAIETHTNTSLRIYDLTGRTVETLINEKMEPGNHNVFWDATGFSSGVYFVKMTAWNYTKTQKVILLK